MGLQSWTGQALRRKTWESRPPERTNTPPLTIRLAGPADGEALRRLAETDSSAAPAGQVLIAEVDGRLWAALSLDDGHAVADPFRPTGELAWLLVEHARRLRRAERPKLTRRLRPATS